MKSQRFIAVDQGNSFFKLTLIVDGDVKEACRVATDATEEFFSVVERYDADCGAFCSVGRIDSRLVESLRMAVAGRLLVLSRRTPLPVSIDYSTPATLGFDRIALASGAACSFPGECVAVVDAGTAITLDVVDSSGCFRGGRITAGMRLRFESLHQFTSALPLLTCEECPPIIGDRTDSCIRSGVVRGISDEIAETFREYRNYFGCTRLVLTGGDAPILHECISTRIPADHVPDLMARGLLYIYNHNDKDS